MRRGIVVSIHAFRGEGDSAASTTRNAHSVSIHAFRGEGDDRTTPTGGTGAQVSIHAFRGEGDRRVHVPFDYSDCFNPRLPGGRRHIARLLQTGDYAFQSTPSGGKATGAFTFPLTIQIVSIHAFRGEGDQFRSAL